MPTIQYPLRTLFDAFDATDNDGTFSVDIPNQPHLLSLHSTSIPLSLPDAVFLSQPCMCVHLQEDTIARVDEIIIDLQLPTPDRNTYILKLNFAKLLHLPCIEPAEELAKVRQFFEVAQWFMEQIPCCPAVVAISNESSINNGVYASVLCKSGATSDQIASSYKTASLVQTRINELIASTPLIAEYIHQMVLSLRQMGPHCSATITETSLFGYSQGPHHKYCWEQVAKNRPENSSLTNP